MFLLDTVALTDLVRGNDNATRQFVAAVERRNLEVFVSVISFGALKAEIDLISDASEREIWNRRFDIALNKYRSIEKLLDVGRYISLEWAILKNMGLPLEGDDELGDDERLVVATAIIERFALVTSTPMRYQPVVERRGLKVQKV